MKEPINLNEQKRIQLEILDDIHMFCLQNGIRYSLAYGTLLGAIRHQGYIPWDDDIDLMMPRTDYEKFLRSYKSEKNEVLDLRNNDCTIELFSKVSRKGTLMIDTTEGRGLWGINIDIFPMDGVPDDYGRHWQAIVDKRKKSPLLCPFYKAIHHNKAYWLVKYIMKRLFCLNFTNYILLKKQINNAASSFSVCDTLFCGCLLTDDPKDAVPSRLFDRINLIKFEGKEYFSITDFDTYLKTIYGDYMQLPPVEDRVSHHLYKAFIVQ